MSSRSEDYPDTPVEKLTKQEQLRMMHLRSHLNQLTEQVKQHQYMTEKTRYTFACLLVCKLIRVGFKLNFFYKLPEHFFN